MKKQRSASPSQAMPRSAPSSRTLSMMNSRFSGSSGLGSWSGKRAVEVEEVRHRVDRRGARAPGAGTAPAIPLPPSTTTRRSRDRRRGRRSDSSGRRSAPAGRRPRLRVARASPRAAGRPRRSGPTSPMPGVAGERQRARAYQLHAGVRGRVVGRGDHAPPSSRRRRRGSRASRWRTSPARRRRRPRRARPRRSAAAIDGDERRMSWPSAIRSRAGARATKARPIALGALLVHLARGRGPRTSYALKTAGSSVTRRSPPRAARSSPRGAGA